MLYFLLHYVIYITILHLINVNIKEEHNEKENK